MIDLNCKKIIFFSTSKVYGDNSFDLQEFDESSELSPLCSYGAAKTQCEEIIQKSASNQTLDYLIFRLPPVLMDHSKSGVGKMLDFVKLNKDDFLSSYSYITELEYNITAIKNCLRF